MAGIKCYILPGYGSALKKKTEILRKKMVFAWFFFPKGLFFLFFQIGKIEISFMKKYILNFMMAAF